MPISLPNAAVGKVVTRFPPEPSWMLDLGHCKASLMNQYIATQFQGKWILRFDDTNPKTCSRQNVEAYLKDLPLLDLHPDRITYASDYFADMVATATGLIEAGFLYADDTPSEEMRAQRLAKQPSPQRSRSPIDSLAAWSEMQAGSEAGQLFCLRFKLDPGSENGALRDPVAWRGIDEPHYKTGVRFRVYPTYDFAAPWLDLAEGVSHALRTLEFRDRDVLYNTVQQAILKSHPEWVASNIWEFPRIHMAYTPQAKVHQKALLAAGLVEGPTDPRLPTLRGLMRAGCHPNALRAFLLEQVSPARKETYHSWDKLWTLNRRLLDPTAARHMAVADQGRVMLTVLGGPSVPVEQRVVWKQGHVVRVVPYKQVWIEQEDAQLLSEGDEITLLAWGNATIQSVTYSRPQQQQQLPAVGSKPYQPVVAADVDTSLDHHQQQQQQQQQQQPGLGVSKPPLAPKTPPLTPHTSPPPPAAAAAAAAAVAPLPPPSPPPPAPGGSEVAAATDATAVAAAAAAGAGGGEGGSGGDAYGGFTDVLALRDELHSKGVWGTSSCASTVDTASIAALGSLMSEVEEAGGGSEQTLYDVTSTQSNDPPIGSSAQQQQQQQQQQEGLQQQRTPQQQLQQVLGSNPAVVSMCAVLNPGGDPKASKLKLHWLPALPEQLLRLRLVRYGHPVLVERVTEEVDVVANFNTSSRVECRAWGDPSLLSSARRGHVVQLQRKGFYIVDQVVLKPAAQTAAAAAAAMSAAPPVSQLSSAREVVVPIGAEAAAAAAAAAIAVEGRSGSHDGQQQEHQQHQTASVLTRGDVDEIVLIYIPDGHTKNEDVPVQQRSP